MNWNFEKIEQILNAPFIINYSLEFFIRTHLYYPDIIYGLPNNLNPCKKIDTCQFNAVLPITAAIRSSSNERLYQELGFEYLSSQSRLRKLCTFYKIVENESPCYLCKYILPGDCANLTQNSNRTKQITCRSEFFSNSFFPVRLRSGIS